MMEDNKKIRELYDCNYIVSDGELYPLQKWYNNLIDKKISEITTADVLRMIRQKEFCSLAMIKAVELLQDNAFAGETYDGELLERISEMDTSFLMLYSDQLKYILKEASDKNETHEWIYEGEREEFRDIVNVFLKNYW